MPQPKPEPIITDPVAADFVGRARKLGLKVRLRHFRGAVYLRVSGRLRGEEARANREAIESAMCGRAAKLAELVADTGLDRAIVAALLNRLMVDGAVESVDGSYRLTGDHVER